MCRIGIQEATTIGAQLLNRFLRSNRSHRQGLGLRGHILQNRLALVVLHRIASRIQFRLLVRLRLNGDDILVGVEILNHAIGCEHQCDHGG